MTAAIVLLAITSAVAVGAGALSVRLHGARQSLERELARQAASFRATKEASDKRAREATDEADRLRAMTLAGMRLSREPVFAGRPSPRDAEELARLVRGMMLVDDVVVTAVSGLSLSRETTARSASLAALAPALSELFTCLTAVGLPVREVRLEMTDATHVVARPLSGRGEGAILLVATTSQPASALVLDAVTHAAAPDGSPASAPGSRTVSTPWLASDLHEAASRGFGSALASALDRALREDQRGLVLLEGEAVLLSGARSGPDADARSKAARALVQLASRAGRSLRSGSLRIYVALGEGYLASWSTCAPGTPHALVTFGEANLGSGGRLDLLVGVVRRGLFARAETAVTGDAA